MNRPSMLLESGRIISTLIVASQSQMEEEVSKMAHIRAHLDAEIIMVVTVQHQV